MKTIRSFVTIAGLSLAVLLLDAAGAKAQTLRGPDFAGTFSLPFEAQWGKTTLPAGDYALRYSWLSAGYAIVEVRGKEEGSPHAFILPVGKYSVSTTKSALVCVRQGNAGIIRALEMPQIGEAVNFSMPPGTQLTAQQRNGSKNIQLAEGPMLIQRISVSLATK